MFIKKENIIKSINTLAEKINNSKDIDKQDLIKLSKALDSVLENKKVNKFFRRID